MRRNFPWDLTATELATKVALQSIGHQLLDLDAEGIVSLKRKISQFENVGAIFLPTEWREVSDLIRPELDFLALAIAFRNAAAKLIEATEKHEERSKW